MTERRDAPLAPVTPDEGWRTWLVGALFTLTLTLGGLGYQSVHTRLVDIEQRGSPAMRERLAAQEERQSAIQAQLTRNAETMQRIEDKLDLALERMHAVLLGRP
jgi:hypothetical protein